MIQTLPL